MDAPLVPGRRVLVGQLSLTACVLVVIALRGWQLCRPRSDPPPAEAVTAAPPQRSAPASPFVER